PRLRLDANARPGCGAFAGPVTRLRVFREFRYQPRLWCQRQARFAKEDGKLPPRPFHERAFPHKFARLHLDFGIRLSRREKSQTANRWCAESQLVWGWWKPARSAADLVR